ncbi:hypothetical protein [Kitasatospora sp. CB01950]|uniref:hypothetical protein n=1 Tax=Kitasatospora sp. CB01950 TaxID=1703930 RepID=UPI00093F8965|nr:hypothetical protein [Kitasatospora sp. CB01950]OKJ17091.1 hypothetical protein AMK19_02980 [Kitasatospora sp. CB01950]
MQGGPEFGRKLLAIREVDEGHSGGPPTELSATPGAPRSIRSRAAARPYGASSGMRARISSVEGR